MGEKELLDRALKLAEELADTTIKLKEVEMKLGEEQNEGNRLRDRIDNIKKEQDLLNDNNNVIFTKLLNEISILKGEKHQAPIIMEEKRPETAIIIITYNTSKFIKKQVELIRKYHKEPVDIIIVDNSYDSEVVEAIKYYNNTELHCRYLKTDASSRNGSDSHSFSSNLAYITFKEEYKYIMFLDHDAFPIMPFSIKEVLGDKMMAGIPQVKGDLEYFWPGALMINNNAIDRGMVDFSTSHELGLDTGGSTYRAILHYGKDKMLYFSEQHVQNPDFNKSMYNFYASINNGMFLHWISGSNWNKEGDLHYDERINSLMNILEEKTK